MQDIVCVFVMYVYVCCVCVCTDEEAAAYVLLPYIMQNQVR